MVVFIEEEGAVDVKEGSDVTDPVDPPDGESFLVIKPNGGKSLNMVRKWKLKSLLRRIPQLLFHS